MVIGCCIFISACGYSDDNHEIVYTEPRDPSSSYTNDMDVIIFKNTTVDPKQYAGLIAFYEQMSFNEVPIECDSDFLNAARQYNQEELYDLHIFVNSLTNEEQGKLFSLVLEKLE